MSSDPYRKHPDYERDPKSFEAAFRRFTFVRIEDVSGTSGTGTVVHGVQFPDLTVAARWNSEIPSTVVYESIEDAVAIHGHNGATKLIWIDEDEYDGV